jgi:tetratricopeptide (TPR) repeat protein
MPLPRLSAPRAFGALLLLLFIAPSREAGAAPARWIKLEADSFIVLSDAPEPAVRDAAVRYAAFRRAFAELFVEPGSPLPRSVLLLFRTERAFQSNVPEAKGPRSRMVNYNVDVDGTPLLSFALAGKRDEAMALTFEFDTIWMLNRMGYAVPAWLSQGAGEVLYGLTLKKGRLLIDNRERGFRDQYPWPQFLQTGESSKAYNDPNELPDFLAQAIGLMHWVLLKDEHTRARVGDLAVRLRTEPAVTALEGVMGVPVDQWTKAIRQHLSRSNGREVAFDETAERARMRISPAPEAEVLATTANLLAGWGQTARADALLDQALTLAPSLPAVQEANARRMLRRDRPDEALRLYREAIVAGTTNSAAYLHSAEARLNDSMSGGMDRGGEGGPQSELAADEIRQAIKLNPGSSEAYRLLGRAFWVLPKVGEAEVAELSRGPLLGERGSAVRYYRSLLYSRLDRTTEADADLRAIIADPQTDPRNRQLARQRLSSEQLRRHTAEVDRLVREQKFAEARQVLQAAAAAAEDDRTREACDRIGRAVDEQAAWSHLVDLQGASSWRELGAAAEKFVTDFPRSRLVGPAKRLAKAAAAQAAQAGDSAPAASADPGS